MMRLFPPRFPGRVFRCFPWKESTYPRTDSVDPLMTGHPWVTIGGSVFGVEKSWDAQRILKSARFWATLASLSVKASVCESSPKIRYEKGRGFFLAIRIAKWPKNLEANPEASKTTTRSWKAAETSDVLAAFPTGPMLTWESLRVTWDG